MTERPVPSPTSSEKPTVKPPSPTEPKPIVVDKTTGEEALEPLSILPTNLIPIFSRNPLFDVDL